MALETGNFIDDLVITNPLGTDAKSEGDDHLRLLKKAVKATFPGMTGVAWRLQTKSSNYTVLVGDNMTVFNCTAEITLAMTAAATIGNGFLIIVNANGAAVTIDPNGAETINGLATLVLPDGAAAIIICNGTLWRTFLLPTVLTAAALTLLDDTSVGTMRTTLGLSTVSQVEAEAGTVTTTRSWTAERVKQAIVALETAQADQAAMEAETDENTYVPPDLINFSPGVAKGWVKAGVAGDIIVSHNVTSVTDTGTGRITVHWDTNFSGSDYVVVATCQSSAIRTAVIDNNDPPAVGTTEIDAYNSADVNNDPGLGYHIMALGDQ